MNQRVLYAWAAGALVLIAVVVAVLGLSHPKSAPQPALPLRVIAAENFWGSLAAQLGGSKVTVTSIVSDPNADPHEYESNTTNARAFATANYVILNGAGYDGWGEKLLRANTSSNRRVLSVATLLGKKTGDNPHFWYSPTYTNLVAAQMERDLIALDPADTYYFEQRYTALQSSLAGYQNRIASIKQQFSGTTIAATEDVAVYLAQAAGLNLISPPAFIEAVGEGNDPPASSVVQFQQQLTSGGVKLLIYNTQTVTPLTDTMKKLAISQHIPTVGVSETIQPANATFEQWMNAQAISLTNALNAPAAGQ